MNKKLFVGLSLALLCAVMGAGGWWRFALKPLEDAKKSVLRSLNSESAQFRDMDYYFTTGSVCGQVDAMKSVDGEAIFVNFVVSQTGKVMFEPLGYMKVGSTPDQFEYNQDALKFLHVLLEGCPD